MRDNDSSQLWQPIAYNRNGQCMGIVLLNKKTGMVAYAPENNGAVQQCKVTEMRGKRVCWNLVDNLIQLQDNTAMSLIVDVNGVLVAEWCREQPHATWTLIPADF